LQAADILLYQANKVPVGEDQRQHIELTRDLGQRFNSKFGETFTIPEGYILKAGAKINDLQDPTAKMSKSSSSANGVIELMDSPEINTKKIKSAVTDTGRDVIFDEKEKPGVSNLLTIYSALTGKTIEQSQQDFTGKGYGDFKGAVAEVVVDYLNPVREKANELLKDETHLKKLLSIGAEKAEAVASKTLSDTYKALGMISRA
jgi:tryptophanyl-tRNA synthetase